MVLANSATIFAVLIYPTDNTLAQIIPDGTLPNNSNVTVKGQVSKITGGTTAGGNLFHSFKEFSVPKSQEAFFNNAVDINNIITRVTGNSISNINGLIRANGSANLFLINPNGIVFDSKAKLDIGGSFIGSTADSIKFDDGSFFSAVSTDSQPLLTINVPLGLQFGSNTTGNIVHAGKLRVDSGKNITLIGNRVENKNKLEVNGGQISIAAISSPGLASLEKNGELLNIEYQSKDITNHQLDGGNAIIKNELIIKQNAAGNTGKIFIHGQESVEFEDATVRSINGGEINLQTNKLSVIDSRIESLITSKNNDRGGDISIQAGSIEITDSRNLRGTTKVYSQVEKAAQGNGGNIDIKTDSLLITNKARISAITKGKGNAGSVSINASGAVELLEGDIFSQVENKGIGNSGNINIQARSLKLDGRDGNRALLDTNVKSGGTGKAGNIFVNATDKIELINGGRIVSNLNSRAKGSGGNISINTRLLSLKRGGRIQALTNGMGKAGNIDILADEAVTISGNTEYTSSAGIYTSTEASSAGKGGDINIITSKLNISNNAVLNARSRSSFKGGNIKATVNTLELIDGGQFLTTAFADGSAGNIEINAKEKITISGSDSSYFNRQIRLFKQKRNADSLVANDTPNSGLLARNRGTNDGGKIVINTEKLAIRDGGILSSESTGIGNSGNIQIDANLIELIDGGQIITNSKDSGSAGNIILNAQMENANRILISGSDSNYLDRFTQASKLVEQEIFSEISEMIPNDSANSAVLAKTQGSGSAGSMTLNVRDLIVSNQAEISASTSKESTGSGGIIAIDSKFTNIFDDAQISVDSQGTGIGGNIELAAEKINLDNGTISAKTRSNTGGDITLNIQDLLLIRNNSQITTTAGDKQFGGDGGNIDINSQFIVALPQEDSDIAANAFSGNGGKININTSGIFGIFPQNSPTNNSDITASSETGINGEINIDGLDIDPNRGLIELPENLADASEQVAQACTPTGRQNASSFVSTGRGGLPLSPNQPVRKPAVITSWVDLPSPNVSQGLGNRQQGVERKRIVEAQKFFVDENGDV
ncbi:MAG: filamentous hemagglutinin N-terminal domain-containing protein, partial [Cyanobacteria bacterium J06633_8]